MCRYQLAFVAVAFALTLSGLLRVFQVGTLISLPAASLSRRRQDATVADATFQLIDDSTYPFSKIAEVEEADHLLSLTPGDLPGYTGWARPYATFAGLFAPPTGPSLLISTEEKDDKDEEDSHALTNAVGTRPMVGHNVTVRLQCEAPNPRHRCYEGGSLFFVRAYGRAVLPGRVTDHRNGSYDVTVFPLDPGRYILEVVMAFSNPPPFDQFPLPKALQTPAYEGYLLPGFPVQFDVEASSTDKSNTSNAKGVMERQPRRRFCGMDELLELPELSPVENARWVVVDKARASKRQRSGMDAATGTGQAVTFAGYQKGTNSLGIQMDYRYKSCSLLPTNQLPNAFHQCLLRQSKHKRFHIILIGDSNIRAQQLALEAALDELINMPIPPFPRIEITRISTFFGLHETLTNVSSAFQAVQEEDMERHSSKTDYFILFNSGLHDISQRCVTLKSDRKLGLNFSCLKDYQRDLRKLLKLVHNFPAKLRVFQSTTAGWPKYGNWGFGWDTVVPQVLPRDPTFIAHLNDAAYEVLSEYNNAFRNSSGATAISTMDGYWLTLARPDHREIARINTIGKHLVHGGIEIVDVLVRKWSMMILESACGEKSRK